MLSDRWIRAPEDLPHVWGCPAMVGTMGKEKARRVHHRRPGRATPTNQPGEPGKEGSPPNPITCQTSRKDRRT